VQEISLKRELSSLAQMINIDALDDWESKLDEYLADLKAGIAELKNAAPQDDEERHQVFVLKKQMIETLVERVTINKNQQIRVEIRLNLLAILNQDAASVRLPAAYEESEIYTCIPDLYPRGGLLWRYKVIQSPLG